MRENKRERERGKLLRGGVGLIVGAKDGEEEGESEGFKVGELEGVFVGEDVGWLHAQNCNFSSHEISCHFPPSFFFETVHRSPDTSGCPFPESQYW